MICQPWISENDLVKCNCPADHGPDQVESSILAVSEILFWLSGSRYTGTCSQTVRPCRQCGCQWHSCGCRPLGEVFLGRSDVIAISEVQLGEETLDAEAYRQTSDGWLLRTDGGDWPCCQDLNAAIGSPGVFAVTYTFGIDPPQSGKNAAIELTGEWLKACSNQECRLPANVTSVVRQGVSFTMADAEILLQQGKTGLYFTDLFLSAANPHRLHTPANVWSPDWPPEVLVEHGNP